MSQPTCATHALPPRLRIALDAIRHGRAVVQLDDDEGDLVVAADRLPVPMMATLIRECSAAATRSWWPIGATAKRRWPDRHRLRRVARGRQ